MDQRNKTHTKKVESKSLSPAISSMAEGGEDSQRLKKIAAAAFDYENDARWADYWSNILIPPHMASRPEVVDHFKRKFYQRYIVLTTIFPTLEFAYPFSSLL